MRIIHLLLAFLGDLRAVEFNRGQVAAPVRERLRADVGDLREVEVNRGQVAARVRERLSVTFVLWR